MKKRQANIRVGLRVVLAIAAKDILDAIKNKTILAGMASALFLIVFYYYMPILSADEQPNLLLYDAGQSELATMLETNPVFKMYNFPSEYAMLRELADGNTPELGVVIPNDFDQTLESQDYVELNGFVLQWVDEGDATELVSLAEDHFSELTGERVEIMLTRSYTYADTFGFSFMASVAFMIAVFMMGVSLVPHMMLEEKKSGSLDALMISPASSWQIVLAKGVAGLFYSAALLVIAYLFFYAVVVHWGLSIFICFLGAIAVIPVGLILGTLCETRQQLGLWAWVVFVPLLLPAFLVMLSDLLPNAVLVIMNWLPSVAFSRALRYSFSQNAPIAAYALDISILMFSAGLAWLLLWWLLRRRELK